MVLYVASAEAPSWTDKLEAWSTFGGAVFAAIAVIVAFLVWRHDQRLRREDQVAAESAQARLVLTQWEMLGDPDRGALGVNYTIKNNSAGAVSNVVVHLMFASERRNVWLDDFLELSAGETRERVVEFESRLPWLRRRTSFVNGSAVQAAQIVVGFTDIHGLNWKRKGRDEPTHIAPIRIKRRITPLLGEYLYLAAACRQLQVAYRRLRVQFMNALESRLYMRGKNPPSGPDNQVAAASE